MKMIAEPWNPWPSRCSPRRSPNFSSRGGRVDVAGCESSRVNAAFGPSLEPSSETSPSACGIWPGRRELAEMAEIACCFSVSLGLLAFLCVPAAGSREPMSGRARRTSPTCRGPPVDVFLFRVTHWGLVPAIVAPAERNIPPGWTVADGIPPLADECCDQRR